MKWKKFFKITKTYILHDVNVHLPTFKNMLANSKECISEKNFKKYSNEFQILENIDTKQLPLTKFTNGVKPK